METIDKSFALVTQSLLKQKQYLEELERENQELHQQLAGLRAGAKGVGRVVPQPRCDRGLTQRRPPKAVAGGVQWHAGAGGGLRCVAGLPKLERLRARGVFPAGRQGAGALRRLRVPCVLLAGAFRRPALREHAYRKPGHRRLPAAGTHGTCQCRIGVGCFPHGGDPWLCASGNGPQNLHGITLRNPGPCGGF